jgi:hypothetical protein
MALLRAAEASLVYAAAATSAAATKVNLVIGFLRMMMEAKRARLPEPSAKNVRDYFITRDHRSASAPSADLTPGSGLRPRSIHALD